MPYTKRKLPSGKIAVSTPHGVKSRGSTPENAQRQINLLRGIEHGWKPTNNNAMSKHLGLEK